MKPHTFVEVHEVKKHMKDTKKNTTSESKLKHDIRKYYLIICKTENPSFFKKVKVIISAIGIHCIVIFRLCQAGKRFKENHKILGKPVYFMCLVINYALFFFHKVDININSEIGAGFHISHVGNIFIGPCKIGNNCTLTHNVTIGQGFEVSGNRFPIIGNNVWIGTGSVIAGNIKTGDDVTISAGSIVTKSIPDRCLVAGNPARVINQEFDNSRMIVYEMQK